MTHQHPLLESALAFRALHEPGRPLVLPNAWDAVTAALVQDAGAAAVATTSAGLQGDRRAAEGRDPHLAAQGRIGVRHR
ncbi:isocitrate lyase/phosphoenolpyruvate mutase family protein, partial [Streptomyces sp. NPDC002386]